MAHLVEKITTFFLWLLNILRQSKNFKGRWSLLVSLFPSSRFGKSAAVAAFLRGMASKIYILQHTKFFKHFIGKEEIEVLQKSKYSLHIINRFMIHKTLPFTQVEKEIYVCCSPCHDESNLNTILSLFQMYTT